jgi:hypothetical protein
LIDSFAGKGQKFRTAPTIVALGSARWASTTKYVLEDVGHLEGETKRQKNNGELS